MSSAKTSSAKTSSAKSEKWDPSVMTVNVDEATLHANIAASLKRPLPQLASYAPNSQHIAIVGGGWSLEDTVNELRSLYHAPNGVKIVALNGAGRWLYERNLRPSMQIVLDAREENAAFLAEPVPGCKYFLASQCHAAVFEACEGRDVTVFHVAGEADAAMNKLFDDHYLGRWTRVPTAGTVGMVAIMLCRLLGFRFQHLFGVDSCYRPDGKHHAYDQPLNDGEGAILFRLAGDEREFLCSAWQASQVPTFIDMIRAWGSQVELEIHGDGLLAHILATFAHGDPS